MRVKPLAVKSGGIRVTRVTHPIPASEPSKFIIRGGRQRAVRRGRGGDGRRLGRYGRSCRPWDRIVLVRADGAACGASTRPDVAALVEVVHGRCRADGLVAGVDRRAARLERDGLRRPAVVCQTRRVEMGVGATERAAGGGGAAGAREAARRAVVDVVAAISNAAGAIAARGAIGDDSVGDGDRARSRCRCRRRRRSRYCRRRCCW